MASEPSVDAGAPNLNLTPEEKRVYGQLFRAADTDNVGVVTGEVAVKFFEKTRLDSRVLGEIWQIADKENRGFLTPAGFGIVLRLIGHAQAGREPSPEVALQPGPVPKFDGFTPTPAPPPPAAAIQAQGTGAPGPIRIPPLTPEKVAQYSGLFERQSLQNGGMLPGEAAKQIFEKSGLPNEVLGRIWMLADTEQRGALVLTEFVIAMHLLTSIKTGALRGLPNILPAALYEAATRRGSAGAASIPRQQSPTTVTPPISAVPRQLTGQGPLPQMRTGSPLGRPPIVAQTTGGEWLVTPADKARFDQLYEELDKTKRGFISGEDAVPFFSQSNLSEDALAQIWDLADINSAGRLTRDEFAVAMYLIRQQRTKRDGSALPTTLPANLIPPSLRQPARPPTATSAFEPPPRPQPPQPKPSAMDDLFLLDDPQPAAAAQVPLATGGSMGGDPFATSISPPAPSSPARASPSVSTFKPFVPSSSFGRGLTSQGTGGSSASAPARPVAIEDDLLGDAEPEVSRNLNSETTELANLSNQIGSLTKQVQDVQGQRTAAQNELSQSSIQKKTFEQRLAQLRAMYEKEAQDVRSLETQLTASKNETKKLQADYAMVDASYQDLQNQHRQIVGALQSDQQENASLKEKIRAVNTEIAQLKPQVEKLKSEARQQKGLVAINKKQLATNEGERDKLKGEVDDLTRSNEELARQISASNSPPPQLASPALSNASANNPFFRRTASTDITATFSPPIRSFTDKAFDDVFGPGPAAVSSHPGTPPPPAAAAIFKQNTGASTGSAGSFATPASTSPNMSRQVPEPVTLAEAGRSNSGFPHFVDAAESLSTSRQVSPPLSRTETNQDAQSIASPIEPAKTGQSLASGSGSVASAGETKPAFGSISGESNNNNNRPATGSGATDPFAAMDQDKAKDDFESAFASFKQARAGTNTSTSSGAVDPSKVFASFNSEFPPISELERDEESDSESERGGFDDDFAPASPKVKPVEKGIDSRVASRAASPVMPKRGLTESGAEVGLSSSNVDDIFGHSEPAPTSTIPPATNNTTTTTTSKSPAPFDELEDDFEGLEDAKEGSADDDFANISRSGLDDFNPVFDHSSSSPPVSQPKSSDATTGGNNHHFGTESSFDFASLSGASQAGSISGPAAASGATDKTIAPAAAAAKAESHDWDALFAGLESATTPTASSHTLATTSGGTTGALKLRARGEPAGMSTA
ncbi:hypothetical protein N0V88_000649 [Collariella sp. IMI 366227]|nr:hypothetical protein N0V88_000649 [Collariella sp. IMI 366227]